MPSRAAILRFRASGHQLDQRLPRRRAVSAFGAAGIRDVQGWGAVALHARVDGVGPGFLDSLRARGSVVEVLSARGTATLVPAEDVAVYTLGTVPADETSLRARLEPFLADLEASGRSAADALDAAKDVARRALADGPLDIGALSGALTTSLPDLSPMCRGRCGVHHIEQGLFDLVGQSGLWRQEHEEGARLYVAIDEPTDHVAARRELVRRYLRCYGPSTPAQFAEWCGIGTADAARSLADGDTLEIERHRYLWADDADLLDGPAESSGVRLLPPRDPYLLDRDRSTLVPDREVQRRVWRAIPTEGFLLVEGLPAATWRAKKSRHRLTVTLDPFAPFTKATRRLVDDEAAAVAALRGCSAVEVVG